MNADNKKTCFVIFPFNKVYQQLFESIYKPALESVGLIVEIAGTPGTDKITDDIEKKIKQSFICLADVSINNPNVWYEVGYAYACGKQVVLVCNEGARKLSELPFDIQHKKVIGYSTVGKDYRERCKIEIIADANAKMKKAERESVLDNAIPQDLTAEDFDILEMIISGRDFGVVAESFKDRKLSIIRLKNNGYIITKKETFKKSEEESRDFLVYFPTEDAIKLKENNPDLFPESPNGWKKEKARY